MPSKLSSRLAAAVQWGVLIALSAGIAAFLLWMHAPAALMLGPLIAGIVVAPRRRQGGVPAAALRARPGHRRLPDRQHGAAVDRRRRAAPLGAVRRRRRAGGRRLEPARLADDALADAARHDGAVGHQPGRRLGDDHHGRALRRRRRGWSPSCSICASCWWPSSPPSWPGCSASTPVACAARHRLVPAVAWLPLAETLALAIVGPIIARWMRIPGRRLPGAAGAGHRAHAFRPDAGSSCRPGCWRRATPSSAGTSACASPGRC